MELKWYVTLKLDLSWYSGNFNFITFLEKDYDWTYKKVLADHVTFAFHL